MKKLLFAFFLLFSAHVSAVDFEIAIGHTTYNQSDNGIWWQQGLEHHFETDSNSISAGVSDYLTDAIRWRVGYMNLGDISSWAIATSDANFTGNGCATTPCAQYDVFIGHGNVQGIYFTADPEYEYGPVKLFAEAGAWIYQASFNMTVIGPGRVGHNAVGWDKDKSPDLQIRPVFGLGVEYKRTQFVLSAYGVDSSGENPDTIPNYRGYATNLSIRRMF